jgi:hypothetical protein
MDQRFNELAFRQLADASAGSPIDFVKVAGTVQVPQDLIS